MSKKRGTIQCFAMVNDSGKKTFTFHYTIFVIDLILNTFYTTQLDIMAMVRFTCTLVQNEQTFLALCQFGAV